METENLNLPFGMTWGLVPGMKAAWGCRLIIDQSGMTDFLYDRQGTAGDEHLTKETIDWLNGPNPSTGKDSPFNKSRRKAEELLSNYEMKTSDSKGYVLYQDDRGAIIASPNGSYGYLYVAAYLYEALPEDHPTRGLEITLAYGRE